MVQWINFFWNNSFINAMRLPLLCRNSKAVVAKVGVAHASRDFINAKFQVSVQMSYLCSYEIADYPLYKLHW